ncbi:MAG: substrate-binding domain-containing protein [Eubacteriales bacterium]|nr:substrate-binding domain-containing protein [Eubacteriales bacterium]
MKKIVKLWGIFLVVSLLFCGCTESKEVSLQEHSAENEKEEGIVQIGLSVDSFVIERWIRDRDMFVSRAKELGAEVNVQDARGDAQEQINQIEYFIKKQMDVIVVIARDCNKLADVMLKARDAGIATVSYDRLIQNADCDLYISFDSRKVGELMAEALIEAIPNGGDVFMIQGSAEDNNVDLASEGFHEKIKGSGLEVAYKSNCQGWLAEQAVEYVEEGLAKYPDVKGIMCGNDDIASQVIQTLAENRKAGEVIVVGQDGDLAACQRIVEGTQYMTAFKSIEELAKQAAEYAVRLGNGEELEEIRKSVNDGSYDVPCVVLEPVAVTEKNMDEIII